jgi:hypothetical protein
MFAKLSYCVGDIRELICYQTYWKEMILEWNKQHLKLLGLYQHAFSSLQPDENSLDFSSCMLRPGIKNAQELACGVCLLNVDSRSRVSHSPYPCRWQSASLTWLGGQPHVVHFTARFGATGENFKKPRMMLWKQVHSFRGATRELLRDGAWTFLS